MSIPVEKVKIPALSPKTRQGRETLNIPFDPEYTLGAYNAVNVCLRVQPSEQVCVITDEVTIEIAAAVTREIEKVGAPYRAWVLEDLADRPAEGSAA